MLKFQSLLRVPGQQREAAAADNQTLAEVKAFWKQASTARKEFQRDEPRTFAPIP